MPVRRLSLAISPVLRFADWMFAGEASGWDLLYLLGATWWLTMMLIRPQIFDAPPLVGMDYAPDAFWVVFVAAVVLLHAMALCRPRMYRLRMGAALVSAWFWLLIAGSISLPGLTTGTGFYGAIGFTAVMLAVYLSGRDAHRV